MPSFYRFSLFYLLTFLFSNHSLDTESETVRARLAEHLNDLLSLGVHGFRIDAAKRASIPRPSSTPLFRLYSPMLNWMFGIDIAPDSVTNILSRLSKHVYVTQEVVDTSGVLMNKHSNVGDVQVYVLSLLLGECAEVWGADWLHGILGLAMPIRLKTHSRAAVSRRLPILTLRVA